MKSLSHIGLFLTPWYVACQAPPSIGFSRQKYWSGLPFPSPHQYLKDTQFSIHCLPEPCRFPEPWNDWFFWKFLNFSMIQQMLAFWSLVLLPFLNPAWTSGSSRFTLLKPGLENFKHYFASVWDECNCAVVWAFFGIAFLWDWHEKWPFPVLWPLLAFSNLLAY